MISEAASLPEPIRLLGVDLGQQRDPTAFCVIERRYIPTGAQFNEEPYPDESGRMVYVARQPVELEYHCRHLERPELGTPYTAIVERIIELAKALGHKPVIVLDETGVGRPVRDLLRAKLKEVVADGFRPKVAPITITGGDTPTRSADGGARVPKRDLAAAALVLMQNGKLKIAEGLALKDVLVRELQNFRVKINLATGHDSYEAWRESEHDDIVLAVALACWVGERMPKLTSVRLPGVIAAEGLSAAPMTGATSAAFRVRRW